MLYIQKDKKAISCQSLATNEMADCIVQLHCMTGCDANSGFYGKGKKSIYDRVVKSSLAKRQLSRCGDSLDIEEEVIEELFQFTRHVIYGDRKSTTMAEARSVKWKTMKKNSFILLPPDADSLRQHCIRRSDQKWAADHFPLLHLPFGILSLNMSALQIHYRPSVVYSRPSYIKSLFHHSYQ